MRFWILAVMVMLGCEDKRVPQGPIEAKGGGYEVAELFEHDGCKVFRFVDAGHYRYWVRCPDGATTAQSCDEVTHTHKCGNSTCTSTTHTPVEVRTTMGGTR